MNFSFRLFPDLPPLTRVAAVSPETSTISVTHGCFVEMDSRFFVEVAWAGDFEAGRLPDSDTVFGSGGCLTEGSVTFASCTATTDFFYHSDSLGPFCISNSLPLFLSMLDDAASLPGSPENGLSK